LTCFGDSWNLEGATLAPRGYPAAGNLVATTVAGDAVFYPGDPYSGELLLATEDNTPLDAPIVTDTAGWELRLKDGRVFLFDEPGELREKRADGDLTEEFRCAQYLDDLKEVQFWVRNLANRQTSFRLQTSKGWFYPDFVCQLTDGRILVVEYKGEYLMAQSEEKRAVGQVWSSRSAGHCFFVMPSGKDFAAIKALV
jgi:type III restriction enzyme